MTRCEHFFRAGRQLAAGERFDIDSNATAAANVPEELAEAGAEVEDRRIGGDIALEEVRAEHPPNGILARAIRLGKTGRVERIQTQRRARTFGMRRLS